MDTGNYKVQDTFMILYFEKKPTMYYAYFVPEIENNWLFL